MKIILFITLCFSLFFITAGSKAANVFSWPDCIDLTKKHHPDLEAARKKIEQTKADVGISRSPYLPEISTSLSGNRTKDSYGKRDTYYYGISGKQLLFDGFKTSKEIEQAKKTLNAAIHEYNVTSSDIRLNLRSAFIQLLMAQETLSIAKEIAGRRVKNLNLVKMRYAAGREHQGSLLTARANKSQADYEVTEAERNINLAKKLLVKSMGLEPDDKIEIQSSLKPVQSPEEKPDFIKIAKNNPVLQQMIELRDSAKYGHIAAKRNFFPKVYASLGAGRRDEKWAPSKNEWSAGIELTLPLFQGGSRFYQVSKTRAEYEKLISQVRSTRDNVIYTLELKWINLKNAVDQVDIQAGFLKAAETRAKIAEAQYSIGVISFDNWIIIEDNYVKTKKTFIEAQANALIAEAEWLQAKGETLEYDK